MYREITNATGQNANNLVKLYDSKDGCCPDTSTAPCMYDVTIPTANAVNNIIFKDVNGVNKTVTFSPAVTGAANVVAAIKAALSGNGFEDDDDAIRGVTAETSGSDQIYHITGEAVIVSMLHNTSTTVNAVPKCTAVNRCTFFYAWPGSASTSTFTYNGVDATIAALTLAGSTAANVVTAIDGAANFPASSVVTCVETATAFEITIIGNGTDTISLGGVDFTRSNCEPGYIA